MKIILSRKGFDSENGKFPSMILPSGMLLSLPIPHQGDRTLFSELTCEGVSVLNLMHQLGMTEFNTETKCHLDPDINADMIARPKGWKGAFGQMGGAQGHLENNGVGIGDLFLFFGWFRKTEEDNRSMLRYVGPHIHLIYGYLQIGEILKVTNSTSLPDWLIDHPHTNREKYLHLQGGSNNTIYVATDELTFLKGIPGYGCFKFHPKLVLTKPGESRTRWDLPKEFQGLKITYHSDSSWKDGYFQSAAKGQEFVIEDSPIAEKWGKAIIEAGLGI